MTEKNDQMNDLENKATNQIETAPVEEEPRAKMSLVLLFWGIFLMIALSLFPLVLAKPGTNHADHNLAMLAFWSMSAALVRGVGYIPTHKIPRWLLGGWATFGSAAAAVILWLFSGGLALLQA